MRKRLLLLLLLLPFALAAQKKVQADVLVIGGGTGGTAAGIQSARSGAKTIIVESTPWLGGMLTAAGVSAVDGNHSLPSGLWAEFRSKLYEVYGGAKGVQTGWVSNTQFEPHVGDSIFKAMAAKEKNLSVHYNYAFKSVLTNGRSIRSATFANAKGDELIIEAKIFIDATELGDVMKAAGVGYDVGMEAGAVTGETAGVERSSGIVQDLTYVGILQDFGAGSDNTIPKPANYDPSEFDGSCKDYYNDKSRMAPTVDAKKMLDYGRLPNNKYMLNWPAYGNDTYLNIVEMTDAQRSAELEKAKQTTLRFIYFIQQQLGFKHLGLSNEFPTQDGLALIPYHREGRRLKGIVRFNMRHIAEPFTYGDPLYRTGISVGDYPIDHHHRKNPNAPQHLHFYPVPSFNVPLGALIPASFNNLIVSEKGISVSNVANGTTRLQPCVLLTGQAAGTLAALCINKKILPASASVREVQQQLLRSKAYIMPYIDVPADHAHFEAVQKIGATGILKGKGIPHHWANQTWFYPDSLVNAVALAKDLNEFKPGNYRFNNTTVTIREAIDVAKALKPGAKVSANEWKQWGLQNFDGSRNISRLELAVLLNHTVDPFSMRKVNLFGKFTR